MPGPTRTRGKLSRTRPHGFRVRPNKPSPTTSVVEKTVRNRRRCGRHTVCPRTLLSRAGTGGSAPATPCSVALSLSRTCFPVSVAFSSVQVDATVSLKAVLQGRCGRHVMCPRSTPFPGQTRRRCVSHVMCPRSTPFPSRGWCGSHIMCFALILSRTLPQLEGVIFAIVQRSIEQAFDERSARMSSSAG